MFRRALSLFVVVVVGACTTNPPPSTAPPSAPAETAAAVATGTPEPTLAPDVSKLFLAQIVAATKGKLTVTGSLEFGSQLGDISGSLTYVGGDSDQTTTIALAGVASTTANVHVGAFGYTKIGDGPWFQDAVGPKVGQDLISVLKALSGLLDKGVEAHNGIQAHRLELPAGTALPPAAFGLTDPAIVSPTVGLVFYAADDGKPLAMVIKVTWTQTVNGQATPVTMTLDMTYTQIGGLLTVSVPEHVWQRFTSKRYHYKIAYPDDWDASVKEKGYDLFNSPSTTYVSGSRAKSLGFSLNTIAKGEVSYNKAHYKWTSNSNVAFTLAGVKARLLTFHGTIGGKKYVIYELLAVKSGYLYAVIWFSLKGHEADDLALFKEILATFAFA